MMETNKQTSEPSINDRLHDVFFEAVGSRDETCALDLLSRDPTIATRSESSSCQDTAVRSPSLH